MTKTKGFDLYKGQKCNGSRLPAISWFWADSMGRTYMWVRRICKRIQYISAKIMPMFSPHCHGAKFHLSSAIITEIDFIVHIWFSLPLNVSVSWSILSRGVFIVTFCFSSPVTTGRWRIVQWGTEQWCWCLFLCNSSIKAVTTDARSLYSGW